MVTLFITRQAWHWLGKDACFVSRDVGEGAAQRHLTHILVEPHCQRHERASVTQICCQVVAERDIGRQVTADPPRAKKEAARWAWGLREHSALSKLVVVVRNMPDEGVLLQTHVGKIENEGSVCHELLPFVVYGGHAGVRIRPRDILIEPRDYELQMAPAELTFIDRLELCDGRAGIVTVSLSPSAITDPSCKHWKEEAEGKATDGKRLSASSRTDPTARGRTSSSIGIAFTVTARLIEISLTKTRPQMRVFRAD
eukprot:7389633-Prymnesium_polylepis.2